MEKIFAKDICNEGLCDKYPKYSNNTQNSTVRKQETSLWNQLNILIETSQRGHSDDK